MDIHDEIVNDPHYHDYVKQDIDNELKKEMEERTNKANGKKCNLRKNR